MGWLLRLPPARRVKRPRKRPDRVYSVDKHQEYACVYDWDDRAG